MLVMPLARFVIHFAKTISVSRPFHAFITAVIILAAGLVGVETNPDIEKRHHRLLEVLDTIIVAIFTIEIAIRIIAEGKKPWRYLLDSWNIFDFLIVAACFLPYDNQYVTVLRLLRLLRALRLLTAFPRLQILVGAIFKSLPSMGYVWLLMGLLFYVYAVAGILLFSKNDPVHFGSLSSSSLSLFQVSTLDGWTELMNIQLYGCDKIGYEPFKHMCTTPTISPMAPAYFISFILICTFVLLNLFIGVVLNGMEEARAELAELKMKNMLNNPREFDRRLVEAEIAKLNTALKVLQVNQVKFGKKSVDQENS